MLYGNDRRRMNLAYILAGVFVALFLFFTITNINKAEKETRKVNEALQNLYRLANILTDVHAVETGQRGFVITGDDIYLFTYNRGLDSIMNNLDIIFPSQDINDPQERDKKLLLDLIQQKVRHSRDIVDIRRTHGRDSAAHILQSTSGEIMMNRIRVRINSMEKALRQQISESNHNREKNIRNSAWEFLVLGVAIFLILFLNYRAMLKELNLRRKNEAILKYNGTLISSIIDPIVTTDLEHRITNWNRYAEELYGWSEEEVIGKNLEELLQERYPHVDLEEARKQFADQGFWKGELIHVARNGKELHILASFSAVKNEAGKMLSVVNVFKDITDKKETEQRLQLLTNHLEQEVQRKAAELNAVFERITDAFIALDNNWNYTYVNKKAAELHNRPPEELIGNNIWELYPQLVGTSFYDALLEAHDTGVPVKKSLYNPATQQWFEDLIYPSRDGLSVYYHNITEKRNAELRLEEAHVKLDSHISNTPMAVIEFDKELQVVKWSPKAVEIFGWQEEEVLQPGFTIYDMVHADELPRLTEVVRMLIENGQSQTPDFRNITKQDEVIFCEWYLSAIRNREGEVAVMALVHDITERRKTELELQETESKFRSLVEESLVGVYIIQNDSFTYINPRFAEIFGYTTDEIISHKKVLDLVADYDREKVDNNINIRMYGVRKSLHYMFDALHKTGKILNVEVFGTFLLYKGEGAVIGTLIDVTERNKYLRMLEASEYELKLLNERSELVGKATQDAIWDWDIRSNRLYGNESFNQLFGVEANSVLRYENFAAHLHPDDSERIEKNLREAIRNKSEFVMEEFHFKTADHSFRIFQDRAYILYDEKGEPYRMLGAMQDVTLQRTAKKQVLIEKQLSDSIINSLPGVFYLFSRDGKMLRWNKNLESISGLTPETIRTMHPSEFFSTHMRDQILSRIRDVFIHGETTEEVALKMPDGRQVHYFFTGMLINYEGEPCVLGVGIDISERVRSQEQLKESEEKFRSLIQQASDGIFISDKDGKLIMVNPSACLLTGYSEEELLRMNISDILYRDEENPININIKEERLGTSITESLLKHKEGHFVFVESSGKQLTGDRFQRFIRDITGRKKAEEEVRISEYKYRLLFEQNPMPMWMISLPEKNFLAVNDAAVSFYGYTREEFLRMNIRDIRPNASVPQTRPYQHQVSHSGIWDQRKKNGEWVKVNVLTHDIIYQGRHAKLELSNDMTEQLQAEEKLKSSHEQLRQLATHLQSIRETERAHMAREIHDELGQQLTGLKMDISWINKKISPEEPMVKQKINETLELVDDTVKTVRRLATQLRPSILDDLGLIAAMEWQSEEFQKRSGIETMFTGNVPRNAIPDEIATGIFRIYQESLTNVMRHSQATRVGANLTIRDGNLELQIADNGVGFNESEIRSKNTLGILGMKERTLMLEGSFTINSRPGKGTTVMISVPLGNKF